MGDQNNRTEIGDIDYSHRGHTRSGMTGFQTGAIFDDVAGAVGGVYDTVAGAADRAAGSTGEAIGRTFDGGTGGGIIEGFMDISPLFSQPDSATQGQTQQGVIEPPEGWEASVDRTGQDGQDPLNFDRNGTPTTDGEGSQQNQGQGSGQGGGLPIQGNAKTLVMVAGAIGVGGYILTKATGSGGERSVPDTHMTRKREVGNGARSSRSNTGNSGGSSGNNGR